MGNHLFSLVAAAAGGGGGGGGGGVALLPAVEMKSRIFGAPKWDGTDFKDLLAKKLGYKIAVKDNRYVREYSAVFELGDCEYGVAVDSFLEHNLAGNTGSEMTTVTRNGDFLKIFDVCCGYTLYRDQVDPSSIVRNRPDDTIVHHGAVCLKNEAKADALEEENAKLELSAKMNRDAYLVFPEGRQSIIGMTSFPFKINLYSIDHDMSTQNFVTRGLKSYDLRRLVERVAFIEDIFKIAQWISTVTKPQVEGFHLIPDIRFKTTNGHHITWTKDYLLKELKLTKRSEQIALKLKNIQEVYDAQLANVEWGLVVEPNILKITRIGFKLRTAVLSGLITREKAIADITKGEKGN